MRCPRARLNPRAVICSDKTGTLTTNQMSVIKVAVVQSSSAQLAEYDVTGKCNYGAHLTAHGLRPWEASGAAGSDLQLRVRR